MKYTDPIYGELDITEPVIQELIESEPLQRLKEVNQYGAAFYRWPHLTTTRFEHSVGVYEILRRLGAPVTEQIVGLLHDAPHTAFSHVSDIVFEDASETFHEKFHEKIIFNSEIPQIMKKHGYSVWEIFKKKNYRYAERDLPDLCADRIDYFFRDCVTDKQITLEEAHRIIDSMTIFQNEIAFDDIDAGRLMAVKYREANDKLWANPLQTALYYLLANAMKLSLEEGIISFDDLFTTDKEVYDKMWESEHKEVRSLLDAMSHIEVREDASDYDHHVTPKPRVVDPWIIVDENLLGEKTRQRLSTLDPDFAGDNEAFIQKLKRGYYIKVV